MVTGMCQYVDYRLPVVGDYLDVDDYIDQMTSLDSVFFPAKSLLEQYINGAAQYLPMKVICGQIRLLLSKGASDENFTSWNDDRHAAIKFLLDEITPYSVDNNNRPLL